MSTIPRIAITSLLALALCFTLAACGSDDGDNDDSDTDTTEPDTDDATDQGDDQSDSSADTNTDAGDTSPDMSIGYDDCDLGEATWLSPFAAFESHRAQLTGPDGVRVTVARDFVSVGVGESAIFELRGLALDLGDGTEYCITQAQALDYENTHHNWLDVATGMADGVRYDVHLFYLVVPDDQDRQGELYEVVGYDGNDQVVWGPVELTLANPE